ncbi:hypothetical protein ACOSQ4_018304 [Xanthoceras sorbifolium]
MKTIADSLTAAGQYTSDQDVILSVLNGLGLEYDPVVVHVTSREDFITLNEAQYLLMAQEQRLERLHSAASLDISNAAAHFSATGQKSQRGGRGNYRGGRGRNPNNKPHIYLADPNWYFDTGAMNHITADLGNIHQQHEYKGKDKLATSCFFFSRVWCSFSTSLSSYPPTKWCP